MIERPEGRLRPWWQVVVAVVALAASVVAVWVTLNADFLAHPQWLAAQKADFILGPVFIGLYWVNRRPHSRFGPILIAFGFVGALYVLQSSSDSLLFSLGLLWENVVGLAAYVLILTFPTGRLDGLASKLILAAAILLAVVPAIVILLLMPQVGAGGSISGCLALCPKNVLAVTSDPGLALDLFHAFRYGVIAVALATAGLVVWRMVTGTPPQRRAMALGGSVALLFLSLQVAFHVLALAAPHATSLANVVAWTFAAARAGLWYGFLAALIGAQLFAARTLQRLVTQSLERPSLSELEAMLRRPLGDPRLRLAFWDADAGRWATNAEQGALERPEAGSGLDLTTVAHNGGPGIAIVHDAQLDDDPELLRAAGAVALLAAENAELDEGWTAALAELRQSRSRVVRAADEERRKLERNLHDGVQQQLVAVAIDVGLAADLSSASPEVRDSLAEIGRGVEEAVDELREIAHGLYPPVLSDWGLVAALQRIHTPASAAVTVSGVGVGRHPPELESAVYYCCVEAIQNALKHGGPSVRVSVALREGPDELSFRVTDSGPGFDPSRRHEGTGLHNMHDRLGAVDGHISITTAPGSGTTVTGTVPLGHPVDDGSRRPLQTA